MNDPRLWTKLCSRRVPAIPGIFLASWAIFATLTVGFPRPLLAEDIQPQDKFEAAIHNTSTSPSVILLTVVDDRTDQARTGCALAPFRLGAIERETGISSAKALEDAALVNTAHVFHFKKQDAIDNIPFIRFPRMCAAVRQGLSVRELDRSGEFMIESTREILGYPLPPPLQ